MKTKLQKLLSLIEYADVVVVDDSPMLHSVEIGDITGEPDNEVLMANWHDAEGQEFIVKFTEKGLTNAKAVDSSIFAEDHEGNESQISLYTLSAVDIEKELK